MSRRWSSIRIFLRTHRVVFKRTLAVSFGILVFVLLVVAVKSVEWDDVVKALKAMPLAAMIWAAAFATASYCVYSCFDIFGRWYTGHRLAWWRSVLTGFISYAFTMSLGVPVGSVGIRMRLYSKLGLRQGVIVRIIGISLTTNWIGYFFLAAAVLLAGEISLPVHWGLGNGGLQVIGISCLLAALSYLLGSAYATRRSWLIAGHTIELPDFPFALLQSVAGAVNWALIALVLYALFQGQVAYFEVLGILLISAIAGAAAHVPGGIGVTEYVFLTMLPGVPRSETLAALVVYRLLYYIIPLILAGLAYLLAEATIKAAPRQTT